SCATPQCGPASPIPGTAAAAASAWATGPTSRRATDASMCTPPHSPRASATACSRTASKARETGSGSLLAEVFPRWPVRGSHAGKAAGLDFDHGLESIAAQCPLLLQVAPDLGELLVTDGLAQHIPVGFGAFSFIVAERCIHRVRRQN